MTKQLLEKARANLIIKRTSGTDELLFDSAFDRPDKYTQALKRKNISLEVSLE